MNNKIAPTKSFCKKGVFPYQYAFTLLIPLRNIFLSPNKLIKRLTLKEDYNVLEIGCGPGYFSLKVAEKIYNGKLFLADLQQEMLDYAKKRMNRKKILNVEYYLCNGRTLEFDKHTFDRVFMVAVFGEIEHKNIYLQQIHSILKDEGILSISELAGNPDKITLFEIKKIVCEKGFELIHVFGNEKNFTLNFKKRI